MWQAKGAAHRSPVWSACSVNAFFTVSFSQSEWSFSIDPTMHRLQQLKLRHKQSQSGFIGDVWHPTCSSLYENLANTLPTQQRTQGGWVQFLCDMYNSRRSTWLSTNIHICSPLVRLRHMSIHSCGSSYDYTSTVWLFVPRDPEFFRTCMLIFQAALWVHLTCKA